jgi:hypothetical protein
MPICAIPTCHCGAALFVLAGRAPGRPAPDPGRQPPAASRHGDLAPAPAGGANRRELAALSDLLRLPPPGRRPPPPHPSQRGRAGHLRGRRCRRCITFTGGLCAGSAPGRKRWKGRLPQPPATGGASPLDATLPLLAVVRAGAGAPPWGQSISPLCAARPHTYVRAGWLVVDPVQINPTMDDLTPTNHHNHQNAHRAPEASGLRRPPANPGAGRPARPEAEHPPDAAGGWDHPLRGGRRLAASRPFARRDCVANITWAGPLSLARHPRHLARPPRHLCRRTDAVCLRQCLPQPLPPAAGSPPRKRPGPPPCVPGTRRKPQRPPRRNAGGATWVQLEQGAPPPAPPSRPDADAWRQLLVELATVPAFPSTAISSRPLDAARHGGCSPRRSARLPRSTSDRRSAAAWAVCCTVLRWRCVFAWVNCIWPWGSCDKKEGCLICVMNKSRRILPKL